MGWFGAKKDPLRSRADKLNAEIAALEEEIKNLQHAPAGNPRSPQFRSTARPGIPAAGSNRKDSQPVFEPVTNFRARKQSEEQSTPGHYNDFGVRKFDILAVIRKLSAPFRSQAPPQSNLIQSIVSGEQGLRPTRYEKRVARNRFLYLFSLLLIIIWGIFYVYIRTQ